MAVRTEIKHEKGVTQFLTHRYLSKMDIFCLFCFVSNDSDVLSMFPCLLRVVTHTFLAFSLPVGHVLGWEREHASLHSLGNFPQLPLGDLHRVGGACPGLAQHWC